MKATDARVVLITMPDADSARRLARALVEESLVACGNVVSEVASIFRWQGEVQEEAEALLVLKTSADRFASMQERVLELHPYDVPEVLALPVAAGSDAYVSWLGDCLSSTRS